MPRDLFSNFQARQAEIPPPSEQGMLGSIAGSAPVQGILGAGDALRDMMSLGYMKNSPTSNFGFTQGSQSGSGTAYNAGNIAGNVGGFVGGGEILDALRFAGEGLPLAGNALKWLGNEGGIGATARRIGGSAIAGAAENPGDRMKGAAMGGVMGAAGETLPILGRGARHISEFLVPEKFAHAMTGKISLAYDAAMDKVHKLYEPITKKFNNYHLIRGNPSRQFTMLSPAITDQFGTDVKLMAKKYLSQPTFKNAHELQKQLGNEIGAIGRPRDQATRNALQAYNHARNAIKNDMDTFLRIRNPKLADQFIEASDLFKNDVVPFRSNRTIHNISEGKMKNIGAKKLDKLLLDLQEQGKLDPAHFLGEASAGLSGRISRGKAAGNILGIGAGALGGGLAGGFVGGSAGSIAGKMLAPSMMELATNPAIERAALRLKPLHDLLVKSIIANKMQGF